jgi:GTPase KRas protein
MQRIKRGDPIFILVGNKCDKTYEREVSKEEGAALARQFGCEFIETSARTAQNVERLFMNLVRSLRQTRNVESAKVLLCRAFSRIMAFRLPLYAFP